MYDLLKNWKMILLIIFIILAVLAISPNLSPRGVEVIAKDKNSTISISVGDLIYQINGKDVTNDDILKNYSGVITVETDKGSKIIPINGTLGIEVKNVSFTRLKFGLDIEGGVRAVIEPDIDKDDNQSFEQVISTLQNRINLYGLREMSIVPVYIEDKHLIEINIAGGTKEELRELLEHKGQFAGKIPLILKIQDNRVEVDLDKKYNISVHNNSISIDGVGGSYAEGGSFVLSDVNMTIEEIREDYVNITATSFTSSDIVLVYYGDPQKASIKPANNGYEWFFSVKLSDIGSKRFAYITKNIPVRFDTAAGKDYLDSKLYLYIDDTLIDELGIVADLKGKILDEPSITGYSNTLADALKQQKKLQVILKSGSLPVEVDLVQIEEIPPKLGTDFMARILLAVLTAVAAVSFIIAVRYRKMKIIIPMIAISMSEVVILLGVLTVFGATLDLVSIAAIIAIIGTGIDSQIIIIDQAIRGEDRQMTMREKISRAFFIILGAGGTVIAAMIPLFAIGALKGFALSTIFGVLIGILITRPAFGEIVKKIV
ncbi:MAG: hypothetical protein ABIA21_00230 [Candidatus Aenigmatarchaeota archaeon]